MVIAGEASGDVLAAELVLALRRMFPVPCDPPAFFGAGGPRMAAAGVDLAFDMTAHSIIGLWEAVQRYRHFRTLMDRLLDLACSRLPDVIVCVDFSGFNRRFVQALRRRIGSAGRPFHNWHPKIVQYVSPQVWASRPGRAQGMDQDYDLLLSLFPFEAAWYARRAPRLKVTFVGHPIADRYRGVPNLARPMTAPAAIAPGLPAPTTEEPTVAILPGSRVSELARHLPVMLEAWGELSRRHPEARAVMVLPDQNLQDLARSFSPPAHMTLQVGGLDQVLSIARVAIASTGTVTLECAWFGVPTVALYRTSWSTYQIGRRLVTVRFLAMPNLLANEVLFPELIQDAATPDAIAAAAGSFLNDSQACDRLRARLLALMDSLGGPGASERAARAILELP
jgi:lipid-A-disaccharide synthase